MGSREQAFCTQPKTSACAVVEYVAASKRMFGLVAGSVLRRLQSRVVRLKNVLRLRWRLKPKTTKPLPPRHSDRRATHGHLTNKREKAYIQHVQVINNR